MQGPREVLLGEQAAHKKKPTAVPFFFLLKAGEQAPGPASPSGAAGNSAAPRCDPARPSLPCPGAAPARRGGGRESAAASTSGRSAPLSPATAAVHAPPCVAPATRAGGVASGGSGETDRSPDRSCARTCCRRGRCSVSRPNAASREAPGAVTAASGAPGRPRPRPRPLGREPMVGLCKTRPRGTWPMSVGTAPRVTFPGHAPSRPTPVWDRQPGSRLEGPPGPALVLFCFPGFCRVEGLAGEAARVPR